MKYSSGEVPKIGDLVSYKGLTLKVNQVCNDCLIILCGDDEIGRASCRERV